MQSNVFWPYRAIIRPYYRNRFVYLQYIFGTQTLCIGGIIVTMLYAVCNMFPFGCFPGVWVLIADVSEHYRFHLQSQVKEDLTLKMEPIQCSETSTVSTETPGKHPKEIMFHLTHGESLQSRKFFMLVSPRLVKRVVKFIGAVSPAACKLSISLCIHIKGIRCH
jgi:hypothetical protein